MDETGTQALAAQPIFSIYFNGFALSLSSSDVGGILMVDGQPQCKLKMSFTTAKTLHKHLSELMTNLETVTNHEIMITDVVQAGLEKLVKEKSIDVVA